MKQILFILLNFSVLSWAQAQTMQQKQKDTIEQYLAASQLYLIQNSKDYTKDRATIALERAKQSKDEKLMARAYAILGVCALKYAQIGLATNHLKWATDLYEKIAQKDLPMKREALLCAIAYQKAMDATPSQNATTNRYDELLQQYKKFNFADIGSFEHGLAIHLLQLGADDITALHAPICKGKAIDSIRFIAFDALWTKKVMDIQNHVLWYYKNHVKSPEIHALEMIYDDFPQSRTYYSYKLQESKKPIFVALSSDLHGDFLWKMVDSLENASVEAVSHIEDSSPNEKAHSIYNGLIHPTEKKNWATLYIGEHDNPSYLSYYNNDQLIGAGQPVNDIHQFRYPQKQNILISGNIVFAINCLAKQESIDVARMPFNKSDIGDFDFDKDSTNYYQLMDMDRVNYNVRLNSDQKKELLEEIKILKQIYPNAAILREDFVLFKKIVDEIDKNHNQMYLSRRGYPGDCLGTILDTIVGKKKLTWFEKFVVWVNKPLKTDD